MAYNWHRKTEREKADALSYRQWCHFPWHGPPHFESRETCLYHITAACYKHQAIIGKTPERMNDFTQKWLTEVLANNCIKVWCWCVLPNHYHALVKCTDLKQLTAETGTFHGRLSREWNIEENLTGKRKCWHRCADRAIRSDRHQMATLNYINNNAVHHGYVERWKDWPWSSASEYLKRVGRDQAVKTWHEYPVLDYGKGWDDPDL